MKPKLDKEQNERYREIAAMPRQDLNAHAWLCEQEQEEYEQELRSLKRQVEEMQKTLEWYANTDAHEIKRRVLGDFAPIALDKGHRARQTLQSLKGESK